MVGPNDPQWTEDDRDKALWWMIHEREKCPSCGTRSDEHDPKQGGDLHAYEWKTTHCRGCEILAQGRDWYERAQKQGSLRRGTTIVLRPTPEPEDGA